MKLLTRVAQLIDTSAIRTVYEPLLLVNFAITFPLHAVVAEVNMLLSTCQRA